MVDGVGDCHFFICKWYVDHETPKCESSVLSRSEGYHKGRNVTKPSVSSINPNFLAGDLFAMKIRPVRSASVIKAVYGKGGSG